MINLLLHKYQTNRNQENQGENNVVCMVATIFNIQLQRNIQACIFFNIPSVVLKDNSLKKRWCSLIKRQDGKDGFSLNSSTVICQSHFSEEQIDISMVTKRWNLKKGVEPCLFEWKKVPTERRTIKRIPLEEKSDISTSNCIQSECDHAATFPSDDGNACDFIPDKENICTPIQQSTASTDMVCMH